MVGRIWPQGYGVVCDSAFSRETETVGAHARAHTHTHRFIIRNWLMQIWRLQTQESQQGCFLSKSQDLRSREARGRGAHPRAREDPWPTSSCQADREHEFSLPPACAVVMPLVDQMLSTRIREGQLLH